MLRASADLNGDKDVDVRAVNGGEHSGKSGLPFGTELVQFAEAIAVRDEAAIAQAREALIEAAGVDVMLEAAAVAANFQRMSRIADATGIPVDKPIHIASSRVRDSLGLDSFQTAGQTKKLSPLGNLLARMVAPLMIKLMPLLMNRK